jgi:hypothetical protein
MFPMYGFNLNGTDILRCTEQYFSYLILDNNVNINYKAIEIRLFIKLRLKKEQQQQKTYKWCSVMFVSF